MKGSAIALITLLVGSVLGATQGPSPAPKPGPEHKKLAYFLGTWKTVAETKPGPFGAGGKYTATDHYEWMPGGFFLLRHTRVQSARGKETAISVLGYDAENKVYTFHEFSSTGEAVASEGTLSGDTWTWTGEMGVQKIKARYTMNIVSSTAYNFKIEAVAPGGDYATIMEGKITKVTAKAAKQQ